MLQDRTFMLGVLKTHLQTEAEKWVAEYGREFIGQNEMIKVDTSIVTKCLAAEESFLYPQPTPMEIHHAVPHALIEWLYPVRLTKQRWDELKETLPEDICRFLEILLLTHRNQPTSYYSIIEVMFGEKRIIGPDNPIPPKYDYQNFEIYLHKRVFPKLNILDLRLKNRFMGYGRNSSLHTQLWTVKQKISIV